jgi:hypothetical protein
VYPDPVRVVSVGCPVEDLLANPTAETNRQYSIEFCGGTHLKNTKDARAFALVSEEGIAKVGSNALGWVVLLNVSNRCVPLNPLADCPAHCSLPMSTAERPWRTRAADVRRDLCACAMVVPDGTALNHYHYEYEYDDV